MYNRCTTFITQLFHQSQAHPGPFLQTLFSEIQESPHALLLGPHILQQEREAGGTGAIVGIGFGVDTGDAVEVGATAGIGDGEFVGVG